MLRSAPLRFDGRPALSSAIFFGETEQMPNQGQTAGQRCEEQVLEQGRSLAYAVVSRIGFGLAGKHDSRGVLHKIQSAAFAFAAMRLLVLTRRALE